MRVHKGILILLITLGTFSSFGQNLLLLSPDSSYRENKSLLSVKGSFSYRSNALSNIFIDRMVFGGFIDENLKNDISDNLINQNRYGHELSGDISYWSFGDSLFKNSNVGILLNVEQRLDAHLSFTDDLFELVYRGNSEFVGETADISRTYAGIYSYQKFGVGLFDKKTFSSLTLSMVNGQNFLDIDIPNASLETSSDMDTIALDYQGDIYFSDSTKTSFWNTNGIGMSIDLNANILLKENSGYINLKVSNLGFISWYGTSHHYEADSSFVYTGVDIVDLFNDSIGSSGIPTLSDTLAYDMSQGKKRTPLPGSASVSLVKKINRKNHLLVGMKIMPYRAYVPRIYVGYQHMLNANSVISTRVTYGGYGSWRIGGHYERLWKDWYVNIGTEDLPGLFLRDLLGKNAYLSVGKFLGKR